ncbi:MAG: DUF222 domain-containing protein [Candidatus Dormibacteraeota bacterium]|uniref:DUF222 domain-containing protein n=1 Tax=Candidatus Dormiibacter inghamiae TaxID=3127013 RepID=A0A934KFX0_9BACT|nr:DUF222 domain-containing protein [Candidatus Dormibacteraeota bacterium]MBJ7606604.1 DUF222 domain-containing protein [Candidatus Dormibacteraeota bacterium]
MTELNRAINRLQAEFTRRTRILDQNQGWLATGALSAQAWLRRECHLTAAAAADRVRMGRRLDDLPQTAAAFGEGAISLQHASLLCRTCDLVGVEPTREAEPILVEAACELDPRQLRIVTERFRYCTDPDGVAREADSLFDRRYFDLSQTWDGIYFLNGMFDAESGEVLKTALNALLPPPAGDDPRSAGQRRADALLELCRQCLDSGSLPQRGGQKPHLHLLAELGALQKLMGAAAPELNRQQMVPAETARRIACDAGLSTETSGQNGAGAGDVLSLMSRVVSGATRRALWQRDGGCRFPGCDRPPDWTDAHHIVHWADGGETELGNLVLLCRRHHRQVHEQGWRLASDEGGSLRAVPP